MTRGVYFIASDLVIDMAIPFLNSFRETNPNIPLCLIPYNDETSKIETLKNRYDFSVFSNKQILEECDSISMHMHHQSWQEYRKLAIWEGEFDEFIYVDIDTLVLANMDFAFKHLSSYDFIFCSSRGPAMFDQVWKKSIRDTGKLTKEQLEFAANTGFIVSRKGALSLDNMKSKLNEASSLSGHMVTFCKEQPFINYMVITSGKKYTSLLTLRQEGIDKNILLDQWAGYKTKKLADGSLIRIDNGAGIFLLHWTGVWRPTNFDHVVFFFLRALRIKPRHTYPQDTLLSGI